MRGRGLRLWRCDGCGHVVFPARVVCSRCHGDGWSEQWSRGGVVEAATVRRHRRYEVKRQPVGGFDDLELVHIASVRTDDGPVVVAWSPDAVPAGTRVRLGTSSGVPVAFAERDPGA